MRGGAWALIAVCLAWPAEAKKSKPASSPPASASPVGLPPAPPAAAVGPPPAPEAPPDANGGPALQAATHTFLANLPALVLPPIDPDLIVYGHSYRFSAG